jgi:Family of unknown function (DUF5372)
VISAVTITDPRHPLSGQRLTLLSQVCARGPGFIAVALADGRRRLVARSATDLDRLPPAAEPAMPRVSVRTLLPLARHVRRMLAPSTEEVLHADPSPSDPPSPSVDDGLAAGVVPAAVAGAAVRRSETAGAASRPAAPADAPTGGGIPC